MEWLLFITMLRDPGDAVSAQIPFRTEALCEAALAKFTTEPGAGGIFLPYRNLATQSPSGRDQSGAWTYTAEEKAGIAEINRRRAAGGARWGMCFRTGK